jgi:hypothetical protein
MNEQVVAQFTWYYQAVDWFNLNTRFEQFEPAESWTDINPIYIQS